MTQPLPVRLQEPLSAVSESTRECIARLIGACSQGHSLSPEEYSGVTVAAVLMLLFEQGGRLRVLLTTRSKALRAHPGQTALPGGKVDADDADEIATALREAREEINLVDISAVHFLCTLPPFISQWKLLVHPIIMFLTDPSILDTLTPNPDEVDRIFTHPLDAIIDPPLASGEPLSGIGSEDWPYEDDYYHPSDTYWSGIPFRMHRLRSASTPIKGLTADILILTAELAFHKPPAFDKLAPGQPSREEIVQWGLSEGQEGHVKLPSNSLHVTNHQRTNAGLSREEAATF